MKIADISHYQGDINWELARKELELIIFRASVGSNKDKNYLSYTAECGVPYGAYHYVKAGTAAEARTEARFFVECANAAKQKPLFYIADIEYEAQNATTTEPVCIAFLEELRALGCKKIGLYINTRYKWAGAAINMCDIMWIPHWGKNDGDVPADQYKPKYYNDLWQYTSRGSINGIKGNVDLNMLNGDKSLSYFTEGWNAAETEEDKSMSEKFTNTHFVEFLKKFVGRPYWYGTCVYACTESTLKSKTNQYPSHYTDSRMSKYKDNIKKHEVCADCIGLNQLGHLLSNL